MQRMGIRALYPKRRRTSPPEKGHTVYPYLVRNLPLVGPNQVLAADTCRLRCHSPSKISRISLSTFPLLLTKSASAFIK